MKYKLTVEALFARVWRDHWFAERFQKSGHAAEVKRNYENHIKPVFGEKVLTKVSRLDVKQWHVGMIATPIAANRSLETFSRMFNYAISEELFDGANPCAFHKVFKERKRKRKASDEEIRKIGEGLKEYETTAPRAAAFLYTLLMSGSRPRFIERAKREDLTEIEGGFGLLSLDGKSTAETGEEEQVILSPHVMQLINSLERRKDGLLFGIKLPTEIWCKIREKAGCPDLWARDFRRTFASVGMSNGVKMDTISELLNHKSVQTTKIYAKLYDGARVQAVREITDKIHLILNGDKAVGE